MTALAFHAVAAPPVRYYSGRETAQRVGLSHERFRKVRLGWTRDRDFPAEVNEPGEPVRYLADAVDRWIERRSRRVHPALVPQPSHDDRPTAPPVASAPSAAARQGRASLRSIREASL